MKLASQLKKTQFGNFPTVSSIDDLKFINSYDPLPKQRLAHETPEKFILFGGGVGSSKTTWLVNHVIYHLLKYPGSTALICRENLSSFKRTVLPILNEWWPWDLTENYNKTDCCIKLMNGSMLWYSGLGDDLNAIKKLKGMNLSIYGIDQADNVSGEFFSMLNSRLRLNIPGIKFQAVLTANPCANWVKEKFVANQFVDHKFINVVPTDNPYLPADYVESLKATLPEPLIQSWLNGDWSAVQDENALFGWQEINEAMSRTVTKFEPVCYGIDVARMGLDSTIVSKRSGLKIEIVGRYQKQDLMETCGKIIQTINADKRVALYIDSVGVGAGVYDRLREQGYAVREVIGSAQAKKKDAHFNLRTENYMEFKTMLATLALPKDEALRAEMMSIKYQIYSDGRIFILGKNEIKRALGHSPDILDAVILACCGGMVGTSLSDMERFLPQFIKQESRQRILDDMRGKNPDEEKKKRSMREEEADWAKEQGWSQIVKPKSGW